MFKIRSRLSWDVCIQDFEYSREITDWYLDSWEFSRLTRAIMEQRSKDF
jgi:hypothetical protein